MKVRYFGRASALVLVTAVAMAAGHAAAQDTAPPPATEAEDPTEVEALVVTGSLIRGTALDTALPVEVHTRQELEKQGAPTALEFAKTLTIAGPTTGEAYYFGGVAPGVVSYNLRGIGADKTLTLMNGRRISENASIIPSIAIARTEVLKDGAAVTYGADAVGGVVNFITRPRYEGLEVSGQYKAISGSDGDYSLGILGGWGGGDVNLMWAAEYEHRSRLNSLERGFVRRSLDEDVKGYNPAPWSTLTNLAGWLPRGALPATPGILNPIAFPTQSPRGDGEWGAPVAGIVSDFTDRPNSPPGSCEAVGGDFVGPFTCSYNYISYYNLVEENDIYRAYVQLNARVNDYMDAHFEVSYGQVESPQIFGSPAQPVITGPALTTGATFQFYVPRTNPYAAAFAAANGVTAAAQGFTPVTYRAFAHGGNPFFGEGNGFSVPSKYSNQSFRVSGSLQGQLGDFGFLRDVGYDAALTYNHSETYADSPDVIGFRLQQALNGFGGPDCNAADQDPARFGTQNPDAAGTNGCMWWNPFSSNFAEQPNLGLSNPNHVAGSENPADLARWLFDPRATETTTHNLNLDLVLNGSSGLTLPGGDVAWAVGFQARGLESRERVESDLYNGTTDCPWPDGFTSANIPASATNIENSPQPTTSPDFRGCTADGPGPFTFFGINPPDHNDQHQYSYFGELQVPILDSLDLQLAVRHEEFSNDLKATVYKVSGRWNVWGPLTLRGSYGTNYQTPPLGTIPGEVNNAVRSYTIAGGNWLGAQFVTDNSLQPETATAWNAGVIWQSRGFTPDHDFRFIVDYFSIETQDEIGQIADPNQIANLVFNGPAAAGAPATSGTITTCDPTVQPLINRVTFNAGCSVGLTSIGSFASIQTLVGNGPGQTTNGFDIQSTYFMPFWRGDLTLGLNMTRVTELVTGPTSLDGVVVSTGDDRLGTLNFATVAAAAPEWRTNFSANYAQGRHNFRLGVNFVSAVIDERAGLQYAEKGEDWIVADFTYRVEVNDDLALTATVANMFDRDPPPAQEELGYDPRLGNPLGRTFEVGFKKTF